MCPLHSALVTAEQRLLRRVIRDRSGAGKHEAAAVLHHACAKSACRERMMMQFGKINHVQRIGGGRSCWASFLRSGGREMWRRIGAVRVVEWGSTRTSRKHLATPGRRAIMNRQGGEPACNGGGSEGYRGAPAARRYRRGASGENATGGERSRPASKRDLTMARPRFE